MSVSCNLCSRVSECGQSCEIVYDHILNKHYSLREIIIQKTKRKCTDCCFFLIFLLCCVGLGATTWYALSRGDPYRILYGSDSFGNTCGRNNSPVVLRSNGKRRNFPQSGQDMSARKYLLPLNLTHRPLDSVWTCVTSCPDHTIRKYSGVTRPQQFLQSLEIRALAERDNISLCVSRESSLKAGEEEPFGRCPKLEVSRRKEANAKYFSISILNRCVPNDIITLGKEIAKSVIQMDVFRGYLADLVHSAPFVFVMCGIALCISLVMVYMLRFFAGLIIYFIYLLVILVSVGISGSLWYSAWLLANKKTEMDRKEEEAFTTSTSTPLIDINGNFQRAALFEKLNIDAWFTLQRAQPTTVLGLAMGASVITIFVVFVVWCLLPRGKKMVLLFQEASRALAAMPILLLQPVISALFVVVIALYSISAAFVLFTAGDLVTREITDGGNSSVVIIESNSTTITRAMLWYQLGMFVWLSEFVMACQRLFITGAISIWYFDSRRGSNRSAICTSACNVFRYHMGSAALGAFIITLVRLPRYILMWMYAKMRGVENEILRRILACFIFILGCIERCLKYINYNTYTVIAYSGMSFIPSCRVAVNLLLDNAVDVATVNTIGDVVLLLAKGVVAATTTTVAMYYQDTSELTSRWIPLVLIFICSYLVANCILSTFEMAIDTIFLCTCEDEAMKAEDPTYETFKSRHAIEQEALPLNQMK